MLTLLIFINIIFIWKFKKKIFFQIKELFLHFKVHFIIYYLFINLLIPFFIFNSFLIIYLSIFFLLFSCTDDCFWHFSHDHMYECVITAVTVTLCDASRIRRSSSCSHISVVCRHQSQTPADLLCPSHRKHKEVRADLSCKIRQTEVFDFGRHSQLVCDVDLSLHASLSWRYSCCARRSLCSFTW